MCHKEMDGEWQNRVLSLDKGTYKYYVIRGGVGGVKENITL